MDQADKAVESSLSLCTDPEVQEKIKNVNIFLLFTMLRLITQTFPLTNCLSFLLKCLTHELGISTYHTEFLQRLYYTCTAHMVKCSINGTITILGR